MWKRLYKKLTAILLKIADILEECADYEIGERRRLVEQKRQAEQSRKRQAEANELFKIDLNKGANRIEGPLIVPTVVCQYNKYRKNEDFIIGVFDNIKSAESAVKSFSTLALSHRAIFSGEPYIDAIVDIKYIQYDNPKDVGSMASDPSLINKSIAEEKIGGWDTIPW
jgi:hypothetical protein